MGWIAISLLALIPYSAAGDLVLSDQESEVYYRLAIAAGDKIQVEKDSEVAGHLHSNNSIDLKQDTLVTGDVSAVGAVDAQGTVTGAVVEGAQPVTLPVLPGVSELRDWADRVFEGDTDFTDAVIDDVVFVDGKVDVHGMLEGVGTIIATRDIRLRQDPSPPAESTRISLIALDDIRLDQDRLFRGVLRAGRDVTLEMGCDLEGVIVADRKVHVKKESRVTFMDLDEAPPEIVLVSPEDGAVLDASPEAIVAAWSDDFSGVDPATASIVLDGADCTAEATAADAGITLALAEELEDGTHAMEIRVSDFSGKQAFSSFGFELLTDTEPLAVHLTSPAQGELVNQTALDVSGTVDHDSAVAEVLVNGIAASLVGNAFSVLFEDLEEGVLFIEAIASDAIGRQGAAEIFVVIDLTPPILTVETPRDGQPANAGTIRVAGSVDDPNGIATVTVDGTPAVVEGADFEGTASLVEGPNTVIVEAADLAGNVAQALTEVTRFSLIDVVFTEPANGAQVSSEVIAIQGTLSEPGASVDVNGLAATVSGSAFNLSYPLREGNNRLTATARGTNGRVGTATINVSRDTTPPRVALTSPQDGDTVTRSPITVLGWVNGLVTGLGGDGTSASVTVNGQPAQVSNQRFVVEAFSLSPGDNLITAIATDPHGNAAEASMSASGCPVPSLSCTSSGAGNGLPTTAG